MVSHPCRAGVVLALAVGFGSLVTGRSDVPSPSRLSVDRPGATLPVVREVRYRMAGKIRPLLFWIGRDHLGAGHIVWRRGADRRVAYELLIGTDPEIAPRRLNRWGYLAEEVQGSTGRVLGAIVDADADTTVGAVETRLDNRSGGNAFKAVRYVVDSESSTARISTVRGDRELTFRDLDTLLSLTNEASDGAPPRVTPRPSGTRSGFLASMGEILHETVEAATRVRSTSPSALVRPRPYIYGDQLHDLPLRSHRLQDRREIGDHTYHRVIHGKFQTRSRETGKRYRFEIVYGTEGVLAEVPIWIRYHPRWWLRVELFLEEDGSPETP